MGTILFSIGIAISRPRSSTCGATRNAYTGLRQLKPNVSDRMLCLTGDRPGDSFRLGAVVSKSVLGPEKKDRLVELRHTIISAKNMGFGYIPHGDARFNCMYDGKNVSPATNIEMSRFSCTNSEEQYMNLLGVLNPNIGEAYLRKISRNRDNRYEILHMEAMQCLETKNYYSNLRDMLAQIIETRNVSVGLRDARVGEILTAPVFIYSSVCENLLNRMISTYTKYTQAHNLLKCMPKVEITHRIAASHLRAEIFSMLEQFRHMDEITESVKCALTAMNENSGGGEIKLITQKNRSENSIGASILDLIRNQTFRQFYTCADSNCFYYDLLADYDESTVELGLNKAWDTPMETIEWDLAYVKALCEMVKKRIYPDELVVVLPEKTFTQIDINASLEPLKPLEKVLMRHMTKANKCYESYVYWLETVCKGGASECLKEKTEAEEKSLLYGNITLAEHTRIHSKQKLCAHPSYASTRSAASTSGASSSVSLGVQGSALFAILLICSKLLPV
ncbi:uncharacterized protein NEMAJ01_2073 [Nematocida major]|uniref:uncharacterized protein n=1 Tax=Nematocida major TaxID=1912982 RepID=UPI002008BBE2|nr:uncharacterized protein NEMAJ01_2073 [Nematocida major]KAH9387177.1 hypothetical protein NEMAJ01_2073 [Nematocida major]